MYSSLYDRIFPPYPPYSLNSAAAATTDVVAVAVVVVAAVAVAVAVVAVGFDVLWRIVRASRDT